MRRAKDIIVLCVVDAFRWKRDPAGNVVQKEGCRVAQFIAVQRRDNNEWALPGVSCVSVEGGSVCAVNVNVRLYSATFLGSGQGSSTFGDTRQHRKLRTSLVAYSLVVWTVGLLFWPRLKEFFLRHAKKFSEQKQRSKVHFSIVTWVQSNYVYWVILA